MREQIVHEQALKSMNVNAVIAASYAEIHKKRTALGTAVFKFRSNFFREMNPNQRKRRKMWANNPRLRKKCS
jgi:3-isopropylmalate dehydratase small subunit